MVATAARAQATRRLWPLACAALALAALWAGPLPELARVSFSAHMILHLGVMFGAAPLLAFGLARQGLAGRAASGKVAIAASLFELAVVWVWHVPGLHEAAVLSRSAFAVQQASFLVAGTLVWLPGFGPTRAAAGAGALALMMSFMHMSMLCVLLVAAPAPIYPDGICGGAWGLDALSDQRLGGVLMALGSGLPYLAGSAALLLRFLTEDGAAAAP